MTRRWVQSATFGGIALILLFIALSTALQSVWMIAYGIWGVLAYEWIFAAGAGRGLRIHSEIVDLSGQSRQRIVSGETVRMLVTIEVPWASRWTAIRWHMRSPIQAEQLRDADVGGFFPFWKPKHVVRTEWMGCRRGRYQSSDLTLQVSDWFGLQSIAMDTAVSSTLVVHPRRHTLSDWNWLLRAQMSAAGEGRSLRFDSPGFPLGVRPHRSGDRPSQIHWPATARVGHVVSRDVSTKINLSVALTLDVEESTYSSFDSSEFEWEITLCASLLEGLSRRGFTVLLCVGQELFHVPSVQGEQQAAAMMQALDYLAEIRPTPKPVLSRTDWLKLDRAQSPALKVWIGPRWNPSLEKAGIWVIPAKTLPKTWDETGMANGDTLSEAGVSRLVFYATRLGTGSQTEIILRKVGEETL